MADYHKVKIRCPECGSIEDAKVEHTLPFWTYIHFCSKCGYVIMESDWEEVETKNNNQ